MAPLMYLHPSSLALCPLSVRSLTSQSAGDLRGRKAGAGETGGAFTALRKCHLSLCERVGSSVQHCTILTSLNITMATHKIGIVKIPGNAVDYGGEICVSDKTGL